MKIWGRANSINVMKVLWAAEECGLKYERTDVGGAFGGNDQKWYLDMNPNGVVPTIDDGGRVVWESNSAVRYLTAKYAAGTLWPNFHWLQLVTQSDPHSPPIGILNLRLEIPLGPTRSRMYSWFAIDKDASPEYRKLSYETYVRTFGPAGIFDQDDMENWEECTAAAKGPAGMPPPAPRSALDALFGVQR